MILGSLGQSPSDSVDIAYPLIKEVRKGSGTRFKFSWCFVERVFGEEVLSARKGSFCDILCGKD